MFDSHSVAQISKCKRAVCNVYRIGPWFNTSNTQFNEFSKHQNICLKCGERKLARYFGVHGILEHGIPRFYCICIHYKMCNLSFNWILIYIFTAGINLLGPWQGPALAFPLKARPKYGPHHSEAALKMLCKNTNPFKSYRNFKMLCCKFVMQKSQIISTYVSSNGRPGTIY